MLFAVTQIVGMAKRLWTDYTTARATKIDNLDALVSSLASAAPSSADYSAARAAKLDNLDALISSRLSTMVKSIQIVRLYQLTATDGLHWSSTRTISAVDVSKTLLFWASEGGRRDENNHSFSYVDATLASSTSISFSGETPFIWSNFYPGYVCVLEFY